jgi:hypothetical protein
MPFPFLPAGALVAVSVLIGALTAFGLVLRATDRAATRAVTGLRDSVLPGLVSGLRGWGVQNGRTPIHSTGLPFGSPGSPPAVQAPPAEIEIVDLDG